MSHPIDWMKKRVSADLSWQSKSFAALPRRYSAWPLVTRCPLGVLRHPVGVLRRPVNLLARFLHDESSMMEVSLTKKSREKM